MITLENKPLYLWDFYFQFSDLLDFLEFSERNIEWQRRSHIQHLNRQAKLKKYEWHENNAELQNIEGRFDVYLSRSIRYSALISLATSIEWIANFLKMHAIETITKPPKGVNKSIHILSTFVSRKNYHYHNIGTLEKIIWIKNCIVHHMGSVQNYKHGQKVSEVVCAMDGFSISDNHFIEKLINIDKEALESIINETQTWLVDFIEDCRQANLIAIK